MPTNYKYEGQSSTVATNGCGPLKGIKVIEIESMGPGPFTAMALADLGANVLRIRRPNHKAVANAVLERNRCGTLVLDMKQEHDKQRLLELIEHADVLLEGFRPGVMERLGLGPDCCLARNPRLVYGRVTGWGREGELAKTAGHDINYIALTGALYSMGTAESGPIPPLNLVGDYGGGGLLLAFGVVCAVLEAKTSGQGQIVDAAMTDGSSMLMAALFGLRDNGRWSAERNGNVLDSSAYYYRCYECADGEWMSVGSMEIPFRKQMLSLLGLEQQIDTILARPDNAPENHSLLANMFKTQTREHWAQLFDGTDACVAPVLSMSEAPKHPHNKAWGTFTEIDGVVHPSPAPRFSRTPPATPKPGASSQSDAALSQWGLKANDLSEANTACE